MHRIGNELEEIYKPYWEAASGSPEEAKLKGPAVRNFLFIGSGGRLFTVVKAKDPERAKELIPILKEELQKVPGMIAVTRQLSLLSSAFRGSRGIEINLMGPDLKVLTAMTQTAFFKLKKLMPDASLRPVPGMELGQPQIQVIPRWLEMAETKLDVFELGYAISAIMDGVYADEVYLDSEQLTVPYLPRDGIDLILISREKDIQRTQDVGNIIIKTPGMLAVPVNTVANIESTVSSEQIQHFERQRSITLEVVPPQTMTLEEGIEIVNREIVEAFRSEGKLTGGYSIRLTGNADKLESTRKAMGGNFILAIFITYLLLAVLFQHWGFPLVIMLSVPLAAVGGVFGLWVLNRFVLQPLDVLTMLGFIILIGVVVNNAILIVYQSLQNIRENMMEAKEAIIDSVRIRIRPIFMSTFTSLFGLMPLVVVPGAGTEIYRGIGVVILFGLFFSTLFTLVLIPCLMNLTVSKKVDSNS
jgi:hydrophobic/amphiphilic exporter-1 (mainly G- bacteria), HAE1 family